MTLSPHSDALGPNRSRKNWNSVGDHAPAYLFNLFLATGEERYRRILEHTFDMIVTHMPDRNSPFVNERFHADWTPDTTWGWQQDRAVVGHNLKIAWNLMRMNATMPKREYLALAERIGATMPDVGRDPQRGGWYDMVQRLPERGRHPSSGTTARPGGSRSRRSSPTWCWPGTPVTRTRCCTPARRRPSTTPSSSTTTRAACTSRSWPTDCPTWWATNASRAATR
ncbi:AGE family epimerase/isomerase [Streptomyces nogalater]